MPKHFVGFMALAASCLVGGCASSEDTAAPVAAATVTIDRTRAEVGAPLTVSYRFTVPPGAPTIDGNYSVFVHVVDGTGDILWTDDHEPTTPTREWKPGTVVAYSRLMFVPRTAVVGPASLEIGLYAPASRDRLRLAGESSGMRAYRVASVEIAPQSESLFVAFERGWHAAESTPDGVEWQWSRGQGVLTFQNPRRDADVLLQLDQPASALPAPQHVEVRVGETVLDSFDLPVGRTELRRVALPAAAQGEGNRVEMTVSVDKTFVPAAVAELRSSDTRELGVRVFRAYLQPK